MFNILTQRLRIREFTEQDAAFVMVLLNTPTWIRNIGNRNIRTIADAQIYIQQLRLNYLEQGYGFYLVETIENQEPIGMCGLIKRTTLPYTDIGFAFLPEQEGKGYATESANAMLTYARQTLQLSTIAAITLPENVQCIRVLEKIGLQFREKISHNEEILAFFITE